MLCLVVISLCMIFCDSSFVSSRQEFPSQGFESVHNMFASNHPPNMRYQTRRDTSSSLNIGKVSCTQSPIQQNVTLKGGLQSGYFRKLAQHVAMKLCVELCCEEKGCDVAFIWGKNCYGVQCFTDDLCDIVPATNDLSGTLMISRVTFYGQKVPQPKKSPEQCTSTQVQPGVMLRGGLNSGNFTHVGTVTSIKRCINICCVTNGCDLALVIDDQCFSVSCYSTLLCEMRKALTKTYQPQLAYVQRHENEQKQNVSTPTVDEISDSVENQLICKNSRVFLNSTLKGGYHAGNYTNFGKVHNMTECMRLCCGNRQCDVALMLENNCFAVACRSTETCLPVPAKTTQVLAALNPTVSFITSRSEEVLFPNEDTPEGVCHAGIVSYDVSLRGGSNAGNFTPHGKVKNIQACISKCCASKRCDVAMMLRQLCYTVVCKNERLCQKIPTPRGSTFKPKMAHVSKEFLHSFTAHPSTSSGTRSHNRPSPYTTLLPHQSTMATAKTTTKTETKNFNIVTQYRKQTEGHSSSSRITNKQYQFQPASKKKLNVGTQTNDTDNTILLSFLRNNTNTYTPLQGDDHLQKHWNSTLQTRMGIPGFNYSADLNNSITNASKVQTNNNRNIALLNNQISNNEYSLLPQVSRKDGQINLTVPTFAPTLELLVTKLTNQTVVDDLPVNEHSRGDITRNNSNRDCCNNSQENSLDCPSNYLCSGEDLIDNIKRNTSGQDNQISMKNNESQLQNAISKTLMSRFYTNHDNVHSENPTCTYSNILQNVTLRGNLRSGKFTDRGQMENIKQCVRLCCMLNKCDLAFMLFQTCFTVECLTGRLCEPVSAKSTIDSPTLCYILVKTAK